MAEIKYFSDTGNVDDLVSFVEKHPEQLWSPEHGIEGERSLLHIAAAYGDVSLCDRLVRMGLSINSAVPSMGNGLPIVEAASEGYVDAVNWFLENGSQVDGPSNSIVTPLMNAVVSGHKEVVELLLNAGADVNRLHLRYNQTPLDLAVVWKKPDIAQVLIDAGGRRAIEQIDLDAERGAGILEHIYDKVGPILSTRLWPRTPPFSSDNSHPDLELRTALISEEKTCKIMFTMGAHERVPRQELMICVSSGWPTHKQCLGDDSIYSFPLRLLFFLAEKRLLGDALKEGDVFDRSLNGHISLVWPDEIDALVAIDYQFDHAQRHREADEDVTLLMLVPIKYPKSGRPPEQKMRVWVDKQRLALWKKIALRSNG